MTQAYAIILNLIKSNLTDVNRKRDTHAHTYIHVFHSRISFIYSFDMIIF